MSHVVDLKHRAIRRDQPNFELHWGAFVESDSIIWWPLITLALSSFALCCALEPTHSGAYVFYPAAILSWATLARVLWRRYVSQSAWRRWALAEGSNDLRAALREGRAVPDRLHQELINALLPAVPSAGLHVQSTCHSPPSPFGMLAGGVLRRVEGPDAGLRAVHLRVQQAIRLVRAPRGTVLEVGDIAFCAVSPWPCVPVKVSGAHGYIECYYELS